MISAWDVYWLVKLDSFNLMFCIFLFVSSVVILAALPVSDYDEELAKKIFKIGVCGFLLNITFFTFIPTTKEVAAIYLIPKIANNKNVQQIPYNTARLLNEKLKEWVADMLEDK